MSNVISMDARRVERVFRELAATRDTGASMPASIILAEDVWKALSSLVDGRGSKSSWAQSGVAVTVGKYLPAGSGWVQWQDGTLTRICGPTPDSERSDG